jgi:hypothetical protein
MSSSPPTRSRRDPAPQSGRASSETSFASRPDGRCPICRRKDGRELVQDHDHRTGLNRAFICRSCNRKLADWDRLFDSTNRRGRAPSRLSAYLRWWTTHPSSVGYTGAGYVNGVFVKSRGRAWIRGMWLAQIRRGTIDWSDGLPRRVVEDPPPPQILATEVERALDRYVKGLSCPVVEDLPGARRPRLTEGEKDRIWRRIQAGERYASIREAEQVALATISKIARERRA